VLDYLPCLDREATQALMEFICAAHAQPMARVEGAGTKMTGPASIITKK